MSRDIRSLVIQEVDIFPDTLIVWTESNGVDMALSFQEAEGCASIWYISVGWLLGFSVDFAAGPLSATHSKE